MTAVEEQPRALRGSRRPIERPRLTKVLDRMEARTIMLVAPAGYGKTTLARQWARTLTDVIWVSATPSHRDVVTFSEDVAAGVDALGGNASRFIGEYMRARSNPQRAAREIAGVLATRVEESRAQWLIVDDYHELAESPEVEEMVAILRERLSARMLVASRVRPHWASTKDLIYGDTAEIGPDELALTPEETSQLVGKRPDLDPLIRNANGWPAVIALASALEPAEQRDAPALPPLLHNYVAEELFQSAPPKLRDDLITLALMPSLKRSTVMACFETRGDEVIRAARDLGFVGGEDYLDLHPLLREFLLAKLAEEPTASDRVRDAVAACLEASAWDIAIDLVLRFELGDLIDPVLQRAFKPLVRSGRVGTLSSVAQRIRLTPGFPAPAVEVIEAEIALIDGRIELAIELAQRARKRLAQDHELRCHASLVAGRALFFSAAFAESIAAYRDARTEAADEPDESESIFGLASAQIFGEQSDPTPALKELERDKHRSPTHLLRHTTAELSMRRFTGIADPIRWDEPLHTLPLVTDPKVRTAFTYTAAYFSAERADYVDAQRLLGMFSDDVRGFALEFAKPFLHWTSALVHLGLRHFGEADRYLRLVEDAVANGQHAGHELNARVLRARLLVQTGEAEEATDLLRDEPETAIFPSWRGEFFAARALTHASLGQDELALKWADEAVACTRLIDVQGYAQAARAVCGANQDSLVDMHRLFAVARESGAWDPVVCALRASQRLLRMASTDEALRPELKRLFARCGDAVMARQAGLRAPTKRSPRDILTPREQEILGLVARGQRNKEIASALFIAESTVKVHVRHILEKLGVRTRAEAVARSERLRAVDYAEATAVLSTASGSETSVGESAPIISNSDPEPSR